MKYLLYKKCVIQNHGNVLNLFKFISNYYTVLRFQVINLITILNIFIGRNRWQNI